MSSRKHTKRVHQCPPAHTAHSRKARPYPLAANITTTLEKRSGFAPYPLGAFAVPKPEGIVAFGITASEMRFCANPVPAYSPLALEANE